MAQYAEGQRLKGSDGNMYVVRNGVPVMDSAPLISSPLLPAQTRRAQNEAAASNFAPQTAQADATIKSAQAGTAETVAQAEARKAEADARKAEVEASGGGPKLAPAQRSAAIQQYTYSQQLQDTIDQLNQLYASGPGATSGVGGLKDFLPLPQNKNFDTAANAARGIVGQTLNFTGGQLNTPQEAAQAIGPFLPKSSDFDSTIIQKIKTLQDLADRGRQNAIATLGGIPDANGNVTPVPQAPAAPTPATGATLPPDQQTLATGGTRDVVDPVLKATAGRIGQMVASGVPDDQILKFMSDSGINPANTNIGETLRTRATDPNFKKWQRANPGAPYPVGPSLYTKQVPMTATRALFNATAANNTGGAVLAAPVAAANALTGGYLNDIIGATGGSAQEAQNGIDLMRGVHPLASLGGDVAGYATAEGLAGLAPGVKALTATKFGRRGLDAAYGAFSGSGENDDNRVLGALAGAPINMAGGMFGRGVLRAAGGAASGITNPDLKLLDQAGIPLTVGRIARGAGDFNPANPSTPGDEFGRTIGGLEDRFAGFPGLDAVIGTARQRGDQAFNQAAFRNIAPGVTGTGADGLLNAKTVEAAAYNKLNPVRLSVDTPFTDSLSAAETAANGLSHHAGDVRSVIGDIRNQIADNGMTGKGYQTALQSIRKTRATLNDDVGGKAANVLNGLEQSVADLGDRQGGQVAQDLAAANAIHANRQIVKTALKSGVAQRSGEMFSPSTLNQASITNTTKFGGLDKALSSDRPFYDLTSAGMKVMPNLTPDSGTAGRLLLYPLIAGAGGAGLGAATGGEDRAGGAETGAGLGLLALGAGFGPYSRTGQRVIQRALLGERPEFVKAIGDRLKMAQRIAGMFGASAARDYFLQPELNPAP
jgi:hypothetical protein